MSRKQVGESTGNSGWIDVSGSELAQLGVEVGDTVDVDVADAKQIAHAIIDSKEPNESLIVTST
jgi:hypothetical protein